MTPLAAGLSPLVSQLLLLALVAIPVAIGFLIEARRRRRYERLYLDAEALARIRAAKAMNDTRVFDSMNDETRPAGKRERVRHDHQIVR